MVIKKGRISPQYLRTDEIYVTIIEVKSPSHFVVKESPSVKLSSEAKKFVEAEEMMQKYYESMEHTFFPLPLKDSIIVVLFVEKYYRAQVRSILSSTNGHRINVYLLDYGRECSVERNCAFQIHQDFMSHPYQAIDFMLLDVEPISLVVSSPDLDLDFGPVDSWDTSAIEFIEEMKKAMTGCHIIVKGVGSGCLFGSLYMSFHSGEYKCINYELISKKFAGLKANVWEHVTKIEEVLPRPFRRDIRQPIAYPSSDEIIESPSTSPLKSERGGPSDTLRKLKNLKSLKSHSPNQIPEQKVVDVHVGCSTSTISETDCKHVAEVKITEVEMNNNAKPGDASNDKTPQDAAITGKSQLRRLLKYHSLKSSQKANNFSSSFETNPTSSNPSSLCSSSSTSPQKGLTPKVEFIDAIAHETPLETSRENDERVENLHKVSESLPTEMKSTTSELTSTATKGTSEVQNRATLSFQDVKNFLYRKRNLNQVLEQSTQDTRISTDGDNKDLSVESKEPAMDTPSKTTETNVLKEKSPISEVPEPGDNSIEKFSDSDNLEDVMHIALDTKNRNVKISPPCTKRDRRKSSTDSTSDVPPPCNIDFSNKSLWEKQKVPALCLGDAIPKPILSTDEASFPTPLHKTLQNLDFYGPSCIQSVVWPSMFRSRCLAAVAPPHSGKTVAYVLPIVANFISKVSYAELPQTNGPVVIILCSSWKKVQHVHDLFQVFLDGYRVKILSFFADGKTGRNKVTSLLNGCEVLISVPCCLLEFFKENVVCVKRCCHFILDDGNTLLSQNMKEVKEIMLHFVKRVRLRSSIPLIMQTLICAERWTKGVASFVDKFMFMPLFLFTSFLESAIFTQVPIFAHVCDESEKNNTLLEVLVNGKKTIICTTSASKASDIHNFLKFENVRSFFINEEMEHYISDSVIQDWKSVKSSLVPCCLVATDSALTHMNISDANCLIHYDVPEISRLQFGNRFSCIAEHFIKKDDIPDCACHILASGENKTQAVSLMKMMKRCGAQVPQELKDLASKRTETSKPADVPLCHYLKAFGICKQPHCEARHDVDPVADKPNFTVSNGDVCALVTHLFDATHFYVRILKHLVPNEEGMSSMSSQYARVGFQLNKFYSLETNLHEIKRPVIGGNYAIQDESKLFYRVKVLNIIEATPDQRQKLQLLYRDEGWVQYREYAKLYQYVDSDLYPPPLAADVFLCGVSTPDACLDWNPQANQFISNLVKGKEIHGKIVLCLGETLWLHPIALREKLISTKDYLNVVTLDGALREAELAKENKEHLSLLRKACGSKIPLPKLMKSSKQDQTSVQESYPISHAFLDLYTNEDVFVSSVISPHQIYVQRAKFVECLDELLDKINSQIEAKMIKKCKTLQKGMHCIAPFKEDGRFYRAKVMDILPDGDEAQLFFVDFGDSEHVSKDSIYALLSEFLLLPFQAIECELDGISAPHGGWTDQVVDVLNNHTRDDEGDMKIVQLKAYTKSTGYEGGNHYVVDLWSGEKTVSHLLLEEGLVCQVEKSDPGGAPEEVWGEDDFLEKDIPLGYAASSDEDLSEEDKNIHSLFVVTVAKMLSGTYDPSQKIGDDINGSKRNVYQNKRSEEISFDSPVREIQDAEISQAPSSSPYQALQKLLNFTNRKSSPKSAKPFVLWWDTTRDLNIVIKLKDVQVYELDLKNDKFTFKTTLGDVEYFLEEDFYASVDSEEPIINSKAEGLSIVLKKQNTVRWPRLTKDSLKRKHIKYDLEHIDSGTEDSSEGEEVIPTPNDLTNDEPVSYLTEDEEDGSASDEERIRSWKKLAEFRDPYDPFN